MFTKPFELVKSKLVTFRTLILTHPQLMPVFVRVTSFWSRFGKIITYSALALMLFLIIAIGINLGINYARLTTDTTTKTVPFSTPSISQTPTYLSPLIDIRKSVQDFNTLLPDPAPPAVDDNITLKNKQ